MSEYLIQGSTLTSIADAIRARAGVSDAFTPAQMVSAIEAMPSGAGSLVSATFSYNGVYSPSDYGADAFSDITIDVDSTLDKFANGTLTTFSNSNASIVKSYFFHGYANLCEVTFEAAQTIDMNAFNGCWNLSIANIPLVTEIQGNAFSGCALRNVSYSLCSYIGNSAFNRNRLLKSVNLPVCVTLSSYAFYWCDRLESISLPACISLYSGAFASCSALTEVYLPQVNRIEASAFCSCDTLSVVSLGSNSMSLSLARIASYAFMRCVNLISLYILTSEIFPLTASNAFSSTPIGGYSESAGTFGSIYVPSSLYDAYISASVWSYFSSRFVSM